MTLNYQIKSKNLKEVLKQDHDFLKKVTQPKQVKEQSAQLNRELEKTGKAIKPLLDTNLTTSCTSSNSAGEESEDIYINISVPKIMDGGTSVHEKKKPENKATTHQSYDQKTVADQNRRKDKKMKSELKTVVPSTGSLTNSVPDKKKSCSQPFSTQCSCCQ